MRTRLIGENQPTIHNILKNRGFGDFRKLTELDSSVLHSPFLMKNMREAIEKVYYHIKETKGYIGIQQDPDADGLMSTSAIYNYLVACFPELEDRLIIFIQDDKSHRINIENVVRWHNEIGEVSLVIAPDCSSNENENHKKLVELIGCDIVVLDHHDMEDYSEYAIVVNPSADDYPNKNLSGVAVCMKFMQGFDELYGFDNSKFYYDLVAVGVTGDMIEINTPETIYMVQQGLKFKNPMLRAIEKGKAYSLGGGMNSVSIAFYIAPVINALTRVGTPSEKAMFANALITNESFTVPSTKRGAGENDTEIYHEQVARLMNNIQARQKRMRTAMVDDMEKQIIENELDKNQILILDTKGEYPSTFNGLIANELRAVYGKPIFVGREFSLEDDSQEKAIETFGGSARGDENSEILPNLKTFNNETSLFDFAQGHEAAHGIQFPLENKDKIIERFNKEFEGKDFAPIHEVDFDVKYKDISVSMLEEITSFFPYWARGFNEPKFVLRDITLSKKDVSIKGDFETSTVSFRLKDGVKFIGFKIPREIAVKLAKNDTSKIDLVGSADLNSYQGTTSLQVKIHEIEVKESMEYYF